MKNLKAFFWLSEEFTITMATIEMHLYGDIMSE